MFRFLDSGGRTVDVDEMGVVSLGEGLLIKDLSLTGTMTLAFQVLQPGFPVIFDVEIDGRRSTEMVHLGESLDNPQSLPFSKRPNRPLVRSSQRPGAIPDAPYVHIWHVESGYGAASPARLTSKTRTELKSLGYVQ
jgi:hypothetical protein